MKIILAGEESAGIRVLRTLISRGHEIVGVCSRADDDESAASVWGVAGRLGLRRWEAAGVSDPSFAATLMATQPDVLLNVHSLHIVHSDVLRVPKWGAYNLHPGPLPRYAGINAPSWAIYRGETSYGVTLHQMDSGIDTGAIVYEQEFSLTSRESALTVYSRCVREGLLLVDRLLEQLSVNPEHLPYKPNPRAERQYFGRSVPNEGKITWTWPAEEIVRLVRASDYHPFPSPWGTPQARYLGGALGIVKADISEARVLGPPGTVGAPFGGAIPVATSSGAVGVRHVRWKGELMPAHEVVTAGELMYDGEAVIQG